MILKAVVGAIYSIGWLR